MIQFEFLNLIFKYSEYVTGLNCKDKCINVIEQKFQQYILDFLFLITQKMLIQNLNNSTLLIITNEFREKELRVGKFKI